MPPAADLGRVLCIITGASRGFGRAVVKELARLVRPGSVLVLVARSGEDLLTLCLTARVLQVFPRRPGLRRTVVNVTSLCALQPFCSWVLYCTGKAAREMMFRVLAEEEPDLRVLNYSPGPLDTNMQVEARSKTADPNMKKTFSDMFSGGQLLTCEASCSKLMKILLEDTFTSGTHIDVFDV